MHRKFCHTSSSSVSNEVTIGNDDVVTMRSHGGRYSWINDDAYTMAQQTSKDGNSFLRTKVFDDGAVNFEANGTFNIETPSVISLKSNSNETLRLRSDNTATFRSNLDVEGALKMPNIQSAGGVAPNVYVDPYGRLYSTVTAYMTEEEVDKKLAIKDKLIEKLSARLDELEKRVK